MTILSVYDDTLPYMEKNTEQVCAPLNVAIAATKKMTYLTL